MCYLCSADAQTHFFTMNRFIVVGILFVILGVLCYFFPMLIAGYNTLSKEEKKKVDLPRLKKTMLVGLSLIGVLGLGFSFLPNTLLVNVLWFALTFALLVGTMIFANKRR